MPLYKELAWIFYHKVGGGSDDAHWYYVRKLAEEWQEILGEPDWSLSNERQIEHFAPVALAPDTLEQLLRQSPEVGPLLQRFASLGFQPDGTLLRQIGRIVMYNHALDAHLAGVKVRELPEQYDSRLVEILADPNPARAAALDALVAYLRKSVIVHEYRMDPAFMYKLMQPVEAGGMGLGPLDFRTAEAHSCYWSALGLEKGGGVINRPGQEMVSIFSQLLLSLKQTMERGRVTFDAATGYVDVGPDLRFIEAYGQSVRNAADLEQQGKLPPNTIGRFDDSRENFLGEAVTFCFSAGKIDDARRYYQQMRQEFGDKPNRPYKTYPLEDYVYITRREMLGNDINPFLVLTLDQSLCQPAPEQPRSLQSRPDSGQAGLRRISAHRRVHSHRLAQPPESGALRPDRLRCLCSSPGEPAASGGGLEALGRNARRVFQRPDPQAARVRCRHPVPDPAMPARPAAAGSQARLPPSRRAWNACGRWFPPRRRL